MMESMGMKVEPLEGPVNVTIRTPSREISIEGAEVTLTRMQGQAIYQIMGGKATERIAGTQVHTSSISEEDIQLVSQQANVTPESARKALEETEGDLAQAILLLAQRRTS
jgi:nascent polypeptide-associated complex subunit alpha